MATTTTTPIAIFRQLASGELSVTEARIALASLTPSAPTKSPRKSIGKRVKATPIEWATPVTSWEDVTERYQYALRYAPTSDPWEVFLAARREYLAHCG